MAGDPLEGTMLGPCRLEALVGRGGMGRVFRARHLALDRVVAVKIVDVGGDGGAAARADVMAEARAAAKLDDPRCVSVYEVGEDKNVPYIVLQWVEGENLAARVQRAGPLPPREALSVMREAAAALRAAHAAGLVHRDVKPGNILIDARGAVKLADFGIARPAGAAAAGSETANGSFHFMAPEQAMGAPPDPRSDLYALAATWYYALTGETLFPGSPMDALLRHREEAPPDVRRKRPEVTEKCSALIARLLAKDPAGRPASAEALLAEMSAVGMLLDTDATGSPFKILPAPPREETARLPEPPASAPPAPASPIAPAAALKAALPPPPPAPAAVGGGLGSAATFYLLFGVIGAAALVYPWRLAVAEDWIAGTAFLAAFPALLTVGDRGAGWRKAAGAALWLGALACLFRRMGGEWRTPTLETLIAAGFGATASGGAVYLGLWGTDKDEILWSRILAPLGGVLLAAAALTWPAPETASWTGFLSTESARVWGKWMSTGGAWRWGGVLALSAAFGAARRLKTVEQKKPGRKLNWNA